MEWKIEIESPLIQETRSHVVAKDMITFGRNAANDLVIDNQYISRNHAVFIFSNGHCFLEDLGSANGTALKKGTSWEPIRERRQVGQPIHALLGKEIKITISAAINTPDVNKTAVFDNAPAESFVSQVLSIKELAKEEALMVLDLCNSTQIANGDDAMAYHLKKRLDHIATDALHKHNVDFFKRTGDGFLASFPTAVQARCAATEILYRIAERNKRTSNLPLEVRIALHKGKTYTFDAKTRDIHGNDVNIVFRIEGVQASSFSKVKASLPVNNRILCSRAFYEDLASQDVLGESAYTLCGSARLKGIELPLDIFRIE